MSFFASKNSDVNTSIQSVFEATFQAFQQFQA